MAGGYTPIFSSVLDGTLYGKWPHTGVWLCLLSQCDWRGNIDMVPKLLASKIGVSEEELMHCIADFMAPDPGSRTGDLEGRRLELMDPENRNWGWRVINHSIYREKARKAAYDAARVADGRNKTRMAARKVHGGGDGEGDGEQGENSQNTGNSLDPRTPAMTRSQTETETQTKTPNTHLGDMRGSGGEKNLEIGTSGSTTNGAAPRAVGKLGNGIKPQTREEKIRLARIGLERGLDEETIRKQYGVTREEVQREWIP